MREPALTLVLRCADAPGIMADVTRFVDDANATILESSHFLDAERAGLSLRVAFAGIGGAALDAEALRARFAPIGAARAMTWQIFDGGPVSAVIMVSRFGHCLFDLVHDWRAGLLPLRIDAIVSNHETHRSFVEWAGLPFHYLPVDAANKADSEAALAEIIGARDSELLVLARYMQVLSPALCEAMAGRCINIHHGFLPSFKGAKPYHQAFDRGVKVIGATAHFVTTDLDEGPIIEQDTVRVDHSLGPDDLIAAGRDVESAVLRRAVSWYAQRRILLDGGKTVVFR